MSEQEDIFIYPISVLQVMEGGVYYDKIEFIFKSEKNKELLDRRGELEALVANNPSNRYATKLLLWDGELINVVEPLEKNLSLLKILYPITFILSIIIVGILSFLLVSRRTLDVAILRVLGVKNREVILNLFRENLILVMVGIVLACIMITSVTLNSYSIDSSKYVLICGGYLLGSIFGLTLGLVKVSNKKPLEMLQVRE